MSLLSRSLLDWRGAGLALVVVAALGPARSAPAAVRAADHGEFGRLVLEWNEPVTMRHSPTGGGLRLELSRPVEGDLAGAAAKIASWLDGIAPSHQAREVDLALPAGVTADIVAAGANLVVLDFKRREAAQPARLRTERHPGFGRIIVEPAAGKSPGLTEEAGRLAIEAGFVWSPEAVRRALDLGPPVDKVHAEGTRLVVSLMPGTEVVRQEADSRRLVLDLRSAESGPARIAGPPPLATRATVPAAEAIEQEPAAGPEPSHRVGIAAELPGLLDDSSPPQIRTRTAGDAVELDIVWPLPVPAASFVRAGRLWLVFGHKAGRIDLAEIAQGSKRLASMALLPHPEATVLTIAGDGAASMTRRGTTWTIRLGGEAAASRPAVGWPPVHGELRIDGAAALAEVDDPVVGDRLGVAMFLESGRGETVGRETVGLEVLPSLQGVVWRALADDVAASSGPAGVVISLPALAMVDEHTQVPATAELHHSLPAPVAAAASGAGHGSDHAAAEVESMHARPKPVPPIGEAAAAVPAPPVASSGREAGPVDLAAGMLPKGQTARDRRRQLELAVLEASGPAGTDRRIDLARMLLAQELAAEAGASLAPVDTDDPAHPAAAALAGIAALLRGQLDDASRALGRPWLDGDREVALWRAALAAARHDMPTALREWRRSGGVPAAYPDGLRIKLGIAGAAIELSDGRTDAALALLDRLRDLPKPPAAAARIRLAEARALDAQGASRPAAAALADALASGDRDTRLDAERLRIDRDLREGRIAPAAALARLEAMRPAWRGHPDEIAYLDQVGRLRARQGDLSAAVAAWEEAAEQAGDPRAKDELRRSLRERVARDLLGEGDGPPLSPLDSLLLYRRHADWLPDGAALAEVERRLAARLARAGIETPAAELLGRRLELAGSAEARADAGVALAERRLADGDPGSALEMLQSTGPERGLPLPLAAQRSDMRKRAAAATGSGADRQTDGTQADRLRAAWEARDWERIETLSTGLLAAAAEPGATESGVDRPSAILGLALAWARRGDGDGLATLDRDHGAELTSGRDRSLLAMLSAGTKPAGPVDLAPVEAGIGAVRAYLQATGPAP